MLERGKLDRGIMELDGLRFNDTISRYEYATKENEFNRAIVYGLEDTWARLSFVISYSQKVSLELYKLDDSFVETDENGNPISSKLESFIDLSMKDYGASVKEAFLKDGISLGYLNGIPITKKICPTRTAIYFRTDRTSSGHRHQVTYINTIQV